MNWNVVISALSGSSISVAITVGLFIAFAQQIIEKAVDLSGKKFETRINEAEEAYKSRLARAEAAFSSQLSQAEARFKANLEIAEQIDVHLREKRIPVYEAIWKTMDVLPKWPRAENVSYEKILKFSQDLRDWYFHTGGMYLSSHSKVAYVALQDTIWTILPHPSQGALSGEHYDQIRESCSKLRDELTIDLQSRRPTPIQNG